MTDYMDRAAVVDYVNTEISYKPGWEIRAMAAPLTSDAIMLTVHFTATNSNREMARQGYPEDALVSPVPTVILPLPAEGTTEDTILSGVLTWLIDIEIHEAREFLRVRGDDMAAPFHPHRWSGQARFLAMDPQWPTSFPDPIGDMEEGLDRDARDSRLAAELRDDYQDWKANRPLFREVTGDTSGLPPELAVLLRSMGDAGELFS